MGQSGRKDMTRAALENLAALSREYGSNPDFVIAGGGNTSVKTGDVLHVKPSGTELAAADANTFLALERARLHEVLDADYPADSTEREARVKRGMLRAMVEPDRGGRPTVEALLHNLISCAYVVHTHPWKVNALTCSQGGMEFLKDAFDGTGLTVPYVDPGHTLAVRLRKEVRRFVGAHGHEPRVMFLQNHGLIVSADTPSEIRRLTTSVMDICDQKITALPKKRAAGASPPDENAAALVNVIRSSLSVNGRKTTALLQNALADACCESRARFRDVALPFTPDQIVYCRSEALFVPASVRAWTRALAAYRTTHGVDPYVVAIQGVGVVAAGDSAREAATVRDVFHDAMKIAHGSGSTGGPHPLSPRARHFIESWEVERYRRARSTGAGTGGGTAGGAGGRTAVVTGGAQGFGEGIVRSLFADGYNVVIADLNEERGAALARELGGTPGSTPANGARFVRADVSSEESVGNLMRETVLAFGGCDVFVSNAGVLRAGGLSEIDGRTFDFMTSVNYTGYFICAKYASQVMQRQFEHAPHFHSDIIQINSKSGLEGSNKNFTYAGGKFGGLGLTQSFALELMPFRIKVNAICPGNFLDGPLWSDPKTGLFVQYLKTGKVPGAETTEDVRRAYESKVPAGRGCTVQDVMRAIRYVIEQEYETGQAVPVTGGQIMLK